MNEFNLAVITGVVSGILVAIFLWILHKLITNTLTPWLEQRLYKGVLLGGVWNATIERKIHLELVGVEHLRNLTLNLSQKGNRISGTFYAKSNSKMKTDGGEKNHEYSNQYLLEGYVRDNYMVMNYLPLSHNRTGLGSFVLQICHGGTKLIGGISFVGEADVETISTIDKVEFIRSV